MSIFRSRKKFTISERDPQYKVRYLGNVQTALMKGDGCVDKATGVLWNNYAKSNGTVGIDMKLQICATGLKAHTKEQGLTEYRAHRISYCIAHPKYPKVFVWVYRHEGKKMKVELRCHAVLCKSDAKAKAMAIQLHDKVTFALQEFMREKTRRQNVRLTLQRTNSLPMNNSGVSGVPMRKKFLTQGGNFKPPIERSASAPKLGDITEDHEGEEDEEAINGHRYMYVQQQMSEIAEDEEEEEEVVELVYDEEEAMVVKTTPEADNYSTDTDPDSPTHHASSSNSPISGAELADTDDTSIPSDFLLQMGNDLDELRRDEDVMYQLGHNETDDDSSSLKSSESGFSEKDTANESPKSLTSSPVTHKNLTSSLQRLSLSKDAGEKKLNGSVGNGKLVVGNGNGNGNGSICTNGKIVAIEDAAEETRM